MKVITFSWIAILILFCMVSCKNNSSMLKGSSDRFSSVYLGGYSEEGITICKFDMKTGVLSEPEVVAETGSPSFFVLHPCNGFIYSVAEINHAGGVKAYKMNQDATLSFVNDQVVNGKWPCHLSFDKLGKFLFVANYGSGNATVLPILEDGSLGELTSVVQHEGSSVNSQRQEGPHAHSINVSPDNKYVYVADLGIDKIMIYQLDPRKGKLVENDPPYAKVAPGAGPRHFTFSPDGKFAYVINELNGSITAFTYASSNGSLEEIQTITTLPEDYEGKNKCAEIRVHPNGKFLYGSNRGFNSIAVYQIHPEKGILTFVEWETETVNWPRHFNFDPSGNYLLVGNRDSDSVSVFRIDLESGALSYTGHSVSVEQPTCVQF